MAEDGRGVAMVTRVTEGKGGLVSHLSLRKRMPVAKLRRDSQHLQCLGDERAICGCVSTSWLWAERPALSDALSISIRKALCQ